MKQFWATFCKEMLVLWRDQAGLLVLFFMPAVLVLVVSLVQNNILKTTGGDGLRVLFVDEDGGSLARQVHERLAAVKALHLVETIDSRPLTEAMARRLVADGDYQFGILVPAGASRFLAERSRQLVRDALGEGGMKRASISAKTLPVVVFFDPTVQGIFRTAVTASLEQALLGIEAAQQGRDLARELNAAGGGFFGSGSRSGRDEAGAGLGEEHLLAVKEQSATTVGAPPQPNAVQQNVPAWALFGMFFIVVPLSGALLRERQEGTLLRLRTLPTSYAVILSGKVAAFTSVCLIQFSLMLAAGRVFLPLLGPPALDLHGHLAVAYLLALCAALAATGYGLLVGSVARSFEQASMFGAVSVVVAAALGGVMVPVYVMPRAMQTLSTFSPLAWGLDGFLKIFVRSGGLRAVAPNAFLLLAFFVVTLGLALVAFRRGGRLGR